MKVIFTGDWSAPNKEAEATNALADAGVDCVNCHIDDLKVVLGVADQRNMFSFGLNTDQSALAPKGYVTGALYAWDKVYGDFISDAVAGKPLPNLLKGGFPEGFVRMGPFGRAATREARARSTLFDSRGDSPADGDVRVLARDCDGDAPWLGPTAKICVTALSRRRFLASRLEVRQPSIALASPRRSSGSGARAKAESDQPASRAGPSVASLTLIATTCSA